MCITKRYRRGIANTDERERFANLGQRRPPQETTLGRVPLPAWRTNTAIESPAPENIAKRCCGRLGKARSRLMTVQCMRQTCSCLDTAFSSMCESALDIL